MAAIRHYWGLGFGAQGKAILQRKEAYSWQDFRRSPDRVRGASSPGFRVLGLKGVRWPAGIEFQLHGGGIKLTEALLPCVMRLD